MNYEYRSVTTGISQPSVLARKQVRNELRGSWQQDEDFFPRLFRMDPHVRETWSKAKSSLYKVSKTKSRWLGIPEDPKSLGPRLYTALNDLMNNVLGYFMPSYDDQHPRLFLRTYRRKVLPNLRKPIWPAILLAGAGSCFVNQITVRPIAHYGSAVSPFEIVLDNDDMELARQRLATVVQEIFNQQPNRRFTFGLVTSASTLTCYLFDHSGVVFSPPLDYHAHPVQFCALIRGLTSKDETDIGLDNSMFADEQEMGRIWTRDPGRKHARSIAYHVNGNLYHAPRIIGRGTTCFLAYQDNPETPFVIKDTWISADDPELEGRDTEGSLLLHAKSKGVVRGVAQLTHSEEVRLKGSNGKLFVDDIYHIRRLKPSEYSQARQRVHTRIVMSTYGKPLEEFSSRKELLLAYHDALRAHRKLYETAGILHRDIKPGNILINSGGEEGDRGVLIDFDHAIRLDNTSPYSLRKKIGTYLFMSSRTLQEKGRHDYLDDLESFYYVLVYILTMYHGPHSRRESLPSIIRSWQEDESWMLKDGHFLSARIKLDISPWFGAPFRTLVERLHSLFRNNYMKAFHETPPPEPITDSDEFLSYVREAITELDKEVASDDIGVVQTYSPDPHTSRGKKYQFSRHRQRTGTDYKPTSVASLRSLRKNVNYSRHKGC